MRASGILLHISSLPSPHGIGTLGREAFGFVDFLAQAGQRYWQVLPLGPTGFGDSPYQSFSTFAGNPYLIDLHLLEVEGLLEPEDYQGLDWGADPTQVDYGLLYRQRFPVLRKAFARGFARDREQVAAWRRENAWWVEDYALFMALKGQFGGAPWTQWEDGARLRQPQAMADWRRRLAGEVDFWAYLQYLFYNQLRALICYAKQKGVGLIGDIPIYVAMDGADVWSHPELFLLDRDLRPTFVAGVPPDYFSEGGQLWGNPLYAWKAHAAQGYRWWIQRVQWAVSIFQLVRIDHFRGFAGYYAVPAGDPDARNGHWEPGPGMDLFRALEKELGPCPVIAEDLGLLTPEVHQLLEESGFPGMKVLQFAFDGNWDNPYLPHNHIRRCVAYTGTHDNDTLASWWQNALSPQERQHAADYLRLTPQEGINWGIVRGAWASVAQLAVAPIQDFLDLGNEARMNEPSTLGGNWSFRLAPGQLTGELAEKIERLSGLYQRSTC